ncbi:nucleotide-binding universal stress UspA family protein [Streptomyces afghaniensis]|nr:nucleotide-binding universal stress UspA family protein [Streptomyces afghaniensis]
MPCARPPPPAGGRRGVTQRGWQRCRSVQRTYLSLEVRGMERNSGPRAVVGVDGSQSSHAALRWAVRYGGLIGAGVEAVAAWELPSGRVWPARAIDATFDEQRARDGLVQGLRDVLGAEYADTVRAYLMQGNAVDVLLGAGEGPRPWLWAAGGGAASPGPCWGRSASMSHSMRSDAMRTENPVGSKSARPGTPADDAYALVIRPVSAYEGRLRPSVPHGPSAGRWGRRPCEARGYGRGWICSANPALHRRLVVPPAQRRLETGRGGDDHLRGSRLPQPRKVRLGGGPGPRHQRK